jgi:hypothetical protein
MKSKQRKNCNHVNLSTHSVTLTHPSVLDHMPVTLWNGHSDFHLQFTYEEMEEQREVK